MSLATPTPVLTPSRVLFRTNENAKVSCQSRANFQNELVTPVKVPLNFENSQPKLGDTHQVCTSRANFQNELVTPVKVPLNFENSEPKLGDTHQVFKGVKLSLKSWNSPHSPRVVLQPVSNVPIVTNSPQKLPVSNVPIVTNSPQRLPLQPVLKVANFEVALQPALKASNSPEKVALQADLKAASSPQKLTLVPVPKSSPLKSSPQKFTLVPVPKSSPLKSSPRKLPHSSPLKSSPRKLPHSSPLKSSPKTTKSSRSREPRKSHYKSPSKHLDASNSLQPSVENNSSSKISNSPNKLRHPSSSPQSSLQIKISSKSPARTPSKANKRRPSKCNANRSLLLSTDTSSINDFPQSNPFERLSSPFSSSNDTHAHMQRASSVAFSEPEDTDAAEQSDTLATVTDLDDTDMAETSDVDIHRNELPRKAQKRIFVGGLSHKTSYEQFKQFFEAFGQLQSAVLHTDRTRRVSRGFGFIQYKDTASMLKLLESKQLVLGGHEINCQVARPKWMAQGGQLTRKLFVGGLADITTSESLKEHFEQFGEVVNAVVMVNPATGSSRRFGFLTFKYCESLDIAQNTLQVIEGKPVSCRKAIPGALVATQANFQHNPMKIAHTFFPWTNQQGRPDWHHMPISPPWYGHHGHHVPSSPSSLPLLANFPIPLYTYSPGSSPVNRSISYMPS
eukprot:g16620.t1